jgi:excisionase family DNA binding protein
MQAQPEQIRRDERGRPIAEDGYPTGGMASVEEASTVSGLSTGMIYKLSQNGELECRRFGRTIRIPWAALRDAGMI